MFRIFEINFSAKREVYILSCEIQKLQGSVIAIKNGQGAGPDNVEERVVAGQFSSISTLGGADRRFPLCLGTGPEEKTLLLGAVPRVEAAPKAPPKKRQKRR